MMCYRGWITRLGVVLLAGGIGVTGFGLNAAHATQPAQSAPAAIQCTSVGTHVEFVNMTAEPIMVGNVEGGNRYGVERTPEVLMPGIRGYYTGSNGTDAYDVRLRIYTAVNTGVGWVAGELRQLVCAHTEWETDAAGGGSLVLPTAYVHANPYVKDAKTYNNRYSTDTLEKGCDYHLDTGNQRLYVKREPDSPSHKVLRVELHQINPTATKDLPLNNG